MAKKCQRCGQPLPPGRNKFHVECELKNIREILEEIGENAVSCPRCGKPNIRRIGDEIFLFCEWCGAKLPKR